MKNSVNFRVERNKAFKRKGFASIEVMIISLVCSILVTILMDNSFKKRAAMERRHDLIGASLSMNDAEEILLNKLIKEGIINAENIETVDFNDGNLNICYDPLKATLKISNKNQNTGVYRQTYYDYRFDEKNNILLKRRRYYEFTN